MPSDGETILESAEFRRAIREYAARLRRILKHIGVSSDFGRLVRRELCQPVTLQRHNRERALDPHHLKQDERIPPEVDAERRAPVPTLYGELLRQWLGGDAQRPLVVIASAGMGKSTLFETFTFELALALTADWPGASSQPLAPVPVLVPLRRLAEHSITLAEAVTRGECLLQQGLDEAPALSRDQLRALNERDRLMLLLDGFDELAASQRNSLVTELGSWNRFAVSSRPEHGAEEQLGFHSRVENLLPLGKDECWKYVSLSVGFANDSKLQEANVRRWFDQASESPMAAALAEPLFLLLWCDHVIRHRRPPSRQADLSDALFDELVRRRRTFRELRDRFGEAAYESARNVLGDYIGELGVCFALHGFEPLPNDHAGLPKRELDALPSADGGRSADGWAWAQEAGVLVRDGPSRIQLLKLPVVEALIGSRLARFALDPLGGAQAFLSFFRRAAWVPSLHDVLDVAFEALRHGTEAQRKLASECCQWLLDLSTKCPLHDRDRAGIPLQFAKDDLLRPFALLALQLGAPEGPSINACLRARMRANRRHPEAKISIIGRIPAIHVLTAMEGLLEALVNPEHSDIGTRLLEGITHTAEGVEEVQAFEAVSLLVGSLPREHGAVAKGFCHAIEAAAGRVTAELVLATVELLVAALVGKHALVAEALTHAIRSAARRVPERSAVATIEVLLAALAGKHGEAVAEGLAWAIGAVAGRVPEASVRAAVELLLAASAENGLAVARALTHAIRAAAGRIAEASATATIADWLAAFVGKGALGARALTHAISAAAGQVPEGSALAMIELLLAASAGKGEAVAEGLAWAIRAVAGRVPEGSAPAAVELLLAASAGKDPTVAKALASAIRAAAARVAEGSARTMLDLLLAGLAEEDPAIASTRTAAIEAPAKRISPKQLFESCVRMYERCRESHRSPPPAVREVLLRTLWDDIPRLRLEHAAELAQRMRSLGDHASAVRVASYQSELAVLLTGFDPEAGSPRYEIRRRSDSTLLMDAAFASHDIQKSLGLWADRRSQYELLRETIAADPGLAVTLDLAPWEQATEQVRGQAIEVWKQAAANVEVNWDADADGCIARYVLELLSSPANAVALRKAIREVRVLPASAPPDPDAIPVKSAPLDAAPESPADAPMSAVNPRSNPDVATRAMKIWEDIAKANRSAALEALSFVYSRRPAEGKDPKPRDEGGPPSIEMIVGHMVKRKLFPYSKGKFQELVSNLRNRRLFRNIGKHQHVLTEEGEEVLRQKCPKLFDDEN